MNTDKCSVAAQVSQSNGENHSMPSEFSGMYQAGFEAGYIQGREGGYEQGFAAGMAAVQQGPNNGAVLTSVIESKPAPKVGPRRMLIGMPCRKCRVYLLSEETHCPCCKQLVA